jgi:hypothetical protein
VFSSWIISTIRAQETVNVTSPSAVLAKLERDELAYVQYVSGCDRATMGHVIKCTGLSLEDTVNVIRRNRALRRLKQTHGKNGVPCLTAIVGLALALLVGCDATGLTVEQTADTPADVPQSIAPQPAPVVPPPAPVPPPVAVPAPLPVPVPPQAAPVQPPLAPGAPLPAPTPPPPVPPCFDRDLGVISPCAGRLDCTVSSTVTERTMCQAGGVVYVPSCETCAGVW